MEKDISNKELLESLNKRFIAIEENMATKEDLKSFATKEDIKVITSDLQETNTKVDLIAKTTVHILENMATKTDLLETENKLQEQINGISTDIKSFKEEVRHELLLNK
jgi:hypothetical protein